MTQILVKALFVPKDHHSPVAIIAFAFITPSCCEKEKGKLDCESIDHFNSSMSFLIYNKVKK
jgi:hypothetical protein